MEAGRGKATRYAAQALRALVAARFTDEQTARSLRRAAYKWLTGACEALS